MQGFSAEGPETQEVVTRRIRSALRPICSVEPPNGGAFSGTRGRSKARERATKTLHTEVMNASWQGLAPCMDGSRTRPIPGCNPGRTRTRCALGDARYVCAPEVETWTVRAPLELEAGVLDQIAADARCLLADD
jgi:hypothetical protein